MPKGQATELVMKVLRNHRNESIDINTIAKESGLTWYAVYRILTERILVELANKHPSAIMDLSIIPEMTSKGLMFKPQIAEEVA